MIKLRFTTEEGKQLNPNLSSIGSDQWLLEFADYTFILTKRKKRSVQVLKTPNKPNKCLNIFYKKTLMGVASHTSTGTIFEYPSPKPIKFPSKLKQMSRIIYERARKTKQTKPMHIEIIKKPSQGVVWKPPEGPEDIIEETYVGDPDNSFLTYYCNRGNSFGHVSEQHMKYLPRYGWNVNWVTLKDMVRWKMAVPAPIGILHPTLYPWFLGRCTYKHLNILKWGHEKLAGFDVADSDHISQLGIDFANQVDLLMVPSECSKTAYVESGLTTNIEVVPHGLSELYSIPKNPFTQNPRHGLHKIPQDGIKILFFQVHSPFRKGSDVAEKVMRRVLAERENVNFVIRGMKRSALNKLPRTTLFIDPISSEEIIRLYDSCDILLLPSRGGGLELNGLEALARGLVLIASDWGAIQEYAEPYALTVKSTGKKVKPLTANPIHQGFGADPDPDHCYELVNYAIDNLGKLRKEREKDMFTIRDHYSWSRVTQEMVVLFKELV